MQFAQQLATADIQQSVIDTTSTQSKSAAIHLHGAQSVTTAISGPCAADRQELESFVRAIYRRAHSAEVSHFMPKLLSVRDAGGKLLAVCGLRHANQENLFLETYFDSPIEALLSQHNQTIISRKAILEVGNLAVADPINVRSLLASISLYLHSTQSEWAVFTGISVLRNSLTKLNMSLQFLGEASIKRIPEHERAAWGTYYNERPQVMAIRRTQPIAP
ncbi:MAG: thermostable hemolysin [Methylotenera sp.]|uniref:thermostable hemolysin n=1 Tax=Methylotenera sp. TaxID=2051956 RepID=UPI00248A24D2|nr:thermostable hemolysin [Methylotenera sp.]MDI1308374.1 thermostable hemolysin [Methylotenera sp.]